MRYFTGVEDIYNLQPNTALYQIRRKELRYFVGVSNYGIHISKTKLIDTDFNSNTATERPNWKEDIVYSSIIIFINVHRLIESEEELTQIELGMVVL